MCPSQAGVPSTWLKLATRQRTLQGSLETLVFWSKDVDEIPTGYSNRDTKYVWVRKNLRLSTSNSLCLKRCKIDTGSCMCSVERWHCQWPRVVLTSLDHTELYNLESSFIESSFTSSEHTRALQPVATCRQSPYLRPIPCYYHYDVILIMTSFSTELATPSVTDVRTNKCTDTLPLFIYKDEVRHLKFDT